MPLSSKDSSESLQSSSTGKSDSNKSVSLKSEGASPNASTSGEISCEGPQGDASQIQPRGSDSAVKNDLEFKQFISDFTAERQYMSQIVGRAREKFVGLLTMMQSKDGLTRNPQDVMDKLCTELLEATKHCNDSHRAVGNQYVSLMNELLYNWQQLQLLCDTLDEQEDDEPDDDVEPPVAGKFSFDDIGSDSEEEEVDQPDIYCGDMSVQSWYQSREVKEFRKKMTAQSNAICQEWSEKFPPMSPTQKVQKKKGGSRKEEAPPPSPYGKILQNTKDNVRRMGPNMVKALDGSFNRADPVDYARPWGKIAMRECDRVMPDPRVMYHEWLEKYKAQGIRGKPTTVVTNPAHRKNHPNVRRNLKLARRPSEMPEHDVFRQIQRFHDNQ